MAFAAGCADPVEPGPTDAGPDPIDAGFDPTCPTPTGGPTMHMALPGDATWRAEDSPHQILADLTIYGTLTLEPCTVVEISPRRIITVRGRLSAEGEAGRPVSIQALTPGSPFANIRTVGGTLAFVHTTIEGGGDPLNSVSYLSGMIEVTGDQTLPTQGIIKADHLTLRGSGAQGMILREGAGFTADSRDLVITQSALFPMRVWARAAGTLPTGQYTGNTIDEILLSDDGGAQDVHEDATYRDHGVPYRVGYGNSANELRVSTGVDGTLGILTLEPGVVVRFAQGGRFIIELATGGGPSRGALVAVGTEGAPIRLTSAADTPAAGDWLGLWFGGQPVAANRIDHAIVEYAGGDSASGSAACPLSSADQNHDAAIRIVGPPQSAFVTNTLIADSLRYGIDRGWRGSEIDLLATNRFERIGDCLQSTPSPAMGACPATPPCPR